jgi:uncharacterized protein DUF4440
MHAVHSTNANNSIYCMACAAYLNRAIELQQGHFLASSINGGSMNCARSANRVAVFTLVVILAAVIPLLAGSRGHDHNAAKAATASRDWTKPIQTVLDAQIAAWNRGDIEAFMAGYWNSPDFIYIGNKQVVHGWQAMLDRYRKSFTAADGSALPLGTLRLDDTQITPLAPDAALVWGTYSVVNPDGKRRGGLYTLVMRKFPEGWRTVYDRTSSEPLPN